MHRHSLLALCATTILAVACVRHADADQAGDFDPSAVANPGVSGAISSGANGDAFFAPVASAAIPPVDAASRATDAKPAPQPSTGSGPAAKPQASGSEDSCCGFLGCLTCRPCPCVYGDVEALFLQPIPRFQNQPIVVDANTGATSQSTSDLNFGVDSGLQATFGLRLCDCCGVEFTYLGLFRDTASAVFDKTDLSSFPIFPNNFAGNVFVNFNHVQTNYSIYLNSFELNFPCCCGCCSQCCCSECCGAEADCGDRRCGKAACGDVRCHSVEWFAGLRYIDIGNDLNIDVQRNEFGGVEEGNYTIHTENRLFGAQLGGRLRSTVNRFGFELTGEAGVYDNAAEQSQTVIDFPNFALRPTTSTAGDNVAFVSQINLSAIYRLTDIWSVKAGYNVIWIEGLALAPDQLDFNFASSPSGNQLTNTGGLFLQGANVGLEARW